MQFVVRCCCPQYLTHHQKVWTKPWIEHYKWQEESCSKAGQPKKPTTSHWLKDEIRLPLIKDFHNNCGYCGESLPTPQEKQASKGDVDHFLPKAIYPEKVYDWHNYIWSCKPCNQLKGEFYSTEYPLLNPCCEKDCVPLIFIEDTGQYDLKQSVNNDVLWQQRLKYTEQKTLLNADEICQKRRLRTGTLRQHFETINRLSPLLSGRPNAMAIIQEQIQSSLSEISMIISSPDFYYLIQDQYKMLCVEYPQVELLLKN